MSGGGAGTNTTNSEATRAQGDETIEPDGEATEHDISTAAESIDPNSESQLHVSCDLPGLSASVVEHKPRNLEVMGSNPAGRWAFSSSSYLFPLYVSSGVSLIRSLKEVHLLTVRDQ